MLTEQHLQLFSELFENITEASTSINLISGHPGGKEIIRHLHQKKGLSHDQSYTPVDKISWSSLKDSYKGAWAIVIGSTGTGAIKASGGNTGSYDAIAVDKATGEIRNLNDSRGGNIMDFFKPLIGKPVKFYVGKDTKSVVDKQRKRADQNQGAGAQKVLSQSDLVKKFKPLWVKAITASIADIKGHVANMVKNDSFDKARKKLSYIESLQNALELLETGTAVDTPGFINSAVNAAVLMAASHYYPADTGDITRGYSNSYNSQNSEGPRKLLSDISNGDTAKLGTILAFFKRTLVSG
jgi:hypothetical protein